MKRKDFIIVTMLFCVTFFFSGCAYHIVKDEPALQKNVASIEKASTDITTEQALAERYKDIRVVHLKNASKGNTIAGKLYCRGVGDYERQVVVYDDDKYIPPYTHPVWEYTLNINKPDVACNASTNDTSPGYRSLAK